MEGRGAPGGGSASDEILALMGEGAAEFDADARLVRATPAFRAFNRGIADFLVPGASWELFLREAERRAGYPPALIARLHQIEGALSDGLDLPEAVTEELPGGAAYSFRLAALSGGGFVLLQARAGQEDAAAEAAREAEALLRRVLAASPVSLTMSRIGDGRIIYRSPAATRLLGTAKTSFAHFADRAERADFVTALLPDGRVDDMRVTGLRADGSAFPARISARLIEYGGEDVIVSSMEDLADEIALEAELARNRERLFLAEKMSALGELLAGVAHELNNPLSIVVGNAGILREDLAGTPSAARIEKLASAADRCVNIVRSFLAMARERPVDLAPADPGAIVEMALDATRGLADAAGVALRADLGALPPVLADRVQLAQVLINLVTNAVHAISGAGRGGTVTISGRPAGQGRVQIRVADDGPGVPEALRGRIFEPLFTTKEPGKGTGVGLALCLRVVAAHHGTLEHEPRAGGGAVFVLELPAA